MGITSSTYYGLTRIRELSPEAQDWAALDKNPELIGLIMKAFEGHSHSGTTPVTYPGYNSVDPSTPTLAALSEISSGGALQAGGTISVRLAYVNSLGLETDASPEKTITLSPITARPLTPVLVSTQVVGTGGLSGGTYVYAITKVKGSGETVISDVLAVTIPFDANYSVSLSFDTINSYTDGTAALNIYRSAGLNSAFQLVTTISTVTASTFTDTNSIAPQNTTVQPPSTTTFDANKKVRIDWSALVPYPATASKLRVYVSQQPGLWSVDHMLTEIDLTASPPTFIDYLGSETLGSGWPANVSQIPANPPKVDLSTQATGAPTLTASMNFAGFQALNLRLHNNSGAPATPTNGYLYYDTSTNNIRGYINGAWTNWGVTAGTAYTHPAEETGGHLATSIRYVTGSGTNNLGTIAGRIVDASGNPKQVQTVVTATPATSNQATSVTSMASSNWVPEMTLTAPASTFTNQYLQLNFDGNFVITGGFLQLIFEVAGVAITNGRRIFSVSPGTSCSLTATIQATGSPAIKVLWWVTAGSATALALERQLVARRVF